LLQIYGRAWRAQRGIMTKPKISVIIPVYNTAPYLHRCLDSVVNQVLQDIEIICVDDCSTDQSLAILNEYAARDGRVKVLRNKENRGQNAARNVALKVAQGEYLGFVDSDDYVDLEFYEKLYARTGKNNADIVKGDIYIDATALGQKSQYIRINVSIHDSKMNFWTFLWSAIYRRILIADNNIVFPEGITNCGDTVFLGKAVLAAKDIQTVDGIFYRWIRRADSISGGFTKAKIMSAISAIEMNMDAINAASNNAIDDEGYAIAFINNVKRLLFHAQWLDGEADKKIVAEALCGFYSKRKRICALDKMLRCSLPVVFPYLRDADISGLTEFLKRCTSSAKLVAANLRERHKSVPCPPKI
jgi:glycosyltransferase involved in cell wall biosynthesis